MAVNSSRMRQVQDVPGYVAGGNQLDSMVAEIAHSSYVQWVSNEHQPFVQRNHSLKSSKFTTIEVIIFNDNTWKYTYFSEGCEQVFGYTSAELIAQQPSWETCVFPEDWEQLILPLLTNLREVSSAQIEYRFYHKNGDLCWVLGNFSSHYCLYTQRWVVACVNLDISSYKQSEVLLEEMHQTLEQKVEERTQAISKATKLKNEFLANMSHELRTPLNAILGITEGLQEGAFGQLTASQLKCLQTIERSGNQLLDLINDILDVAKIEAGKVELDYHPASIASLCYTCLDLIRPQANKKEITLILNLPPVLPEATLDERRICQVVTNLLSNAVKFTPVGGTITLDVGISSTEPVELCSKKQTARLDIAVTDTGIGISPEHLKILFRPFYQIDSRLNRQYAGTGLGLALVKGIVDLHGGNVNVTSQPGQGSCFTIQLPVILSMISSHEVVAPSLPFDIISTPPHNHSPLILLAEDNEANISTIRSYLQTKNYQVLVAKNGDEAIILTETQQPDLILMDIQMPGVDGLEAIRKIRAIHDIVHIPIVALTALAMTGDEELCLVAGADAYLSKPVKLKYLESKIQKLLDFQPHG